MKTLPSDVALCSGVRDVDWREGCEDCLRRTSPAPDLDRVVWMVPPPLVVFECEARIEP